MDAEVTTVGKRRLLIIGVGNAYRHDDAVGLVVAERVREETNDSVEVIIQSGEGATLMDSWEGADVVVICDAVFSGAGPGTIFRFDVGSRPLPGALFRCSTHDFGVAEAVEMARVLGKLPRHLIVYGIEGVNFEHGAGLTPEVEEAVEDAVNYVLALPDVKAAMA